MNRSSNRTQRLQAEPAYESAHLIARDLVTRIEELLQDQPAPGTEDVRIHWGHVGDMMHVNAQLAEVVRFLAGGEN